MPTLTDWADGGLLLIGATAITHADTVMQFVAAFVVGWFCLTVYTHNLRRR